MENDPVYHTNNPNYAPFQLREGPDVTKVDLIGPPLEDTPNANVKKQGQKRRTSSRDQPQADLERFTGMTRGVRETLKDNLDLILNKELKRTVLQAFHPYIEFVDLLLASGINITSRDEFIYSLDFYDDHIETDEKGWPIPSKMDLDLRRRDNSNTNYQDMEIEPRLDESENEDDEFNVNDIVILSKDLVEYYSIPGYLARLWTSKKGQQLRDLIQPIIANVTKYVQAKYDLSSTWLTDSFANTMEYLRTNMITGIPVRILESLASFGTAGLKFLWKGGEAIFQAVKILTKDLIGNELQAHIGRHFESQHVGFIGAAVDRYLKESNGPESDCDQLIENYAAQFVISVYNDIASRHLNVSIPDAARKPPDARQFQEQLFRLIYANSITTNLPTNNFQGIQQQANIGLGFSAREGVAAQTNLYHMRRQRKRVKKEVKWYSRLLPMAALIEGLNNLKEAVQDDKIMQGFWIHPIREFTYNMKKNMQGNIDAIKKEFKAKIATRLDLPKKRAVLAKKKVLVDELQQRRGVAEAMRNKAAQQLQQRLDQNNVVGLKELRDTLEYCEKQEKDLREKDAAANENYQQYRTHVNMLEKKDRDLKEKVDNQYTSIANALKEYEEGLTQEITKIKAIPDNNQKLQQAKGAVDQLRKEIARVKETILQKHYENFKAAYEKEYKKSRNLYLDPKAAPNPVAVPSLIPNISLNPRATNATLNVPQMEKFVDDRLRTRRDVGIISDKLNEMFKALELVATLQSEAAGKEIVGQANVENIIYQAEALSEVLVLLRMQDYDIIFAVADTDFIGDEFVDNLPEIERQLFQDFQTFSQWSRNNAGPDDDTIYSKYELEKIDQINFETRSKQDWTRALRSNKFYSRDDDERYKAFLFFENSKIPALALNLHAIIFKPKIKGCIQLAADEINLVPRLKQTSFDVDQLIFSPYVNGNFAKFVMFIYNNRSVSSPVGIIRGMMPYVNNNLQVQARSGGRTRFNINEDGEFMQGVINFFTNVELDEESQLLRYRDPLQSVQPGPWPHGGGRPLPLQNYRIDVPVFQPFLRKGNNKRQRVDFHY
jgi:hypothetical protein